MGDSKPTRKELNTVLDYVKQLEYERDYWKKSTLMLKLNKSHGVSICEICKHNSQMPTVEPCESCIEWTDFEFLLDE